MQSVLYVDDEPDIRKIANVALTVIGKLTVRLASSGADALTMAREQPPDVILLDVMMPNMDGIETFAALAADPATAAIPIVFMTARVQPAEIERYLALGARGVIKKPFDPMTLAADVRRLVDSPR